MGIKYYDINIQPSNTEAEIIDMFLGCVEWLKTVPGLTFDNVNTPASGIYKRIAVFKHGDVNLAFGLSFYSPSLVYRLAMGYVDNVMSESIFTNNCFHNASNTSTIASTRLGAVYSSDGSTLYLAIDSNLGQVIIPWVNSKPRVLCYKTTTPDGVDNTLYNMNCNLNLQLNLPYVYTMNSEFDTAKWLGNAFRGLFSTSQGKVLKTKALIIQNTPGTTFEACDDVYSIIAYDYLAGSILTVGTEQYAIIINNLAIKI